MRLFKCSACGHRMRLRGAQCGYCSQYKPFHQRVEFWIVIAIAIIVGLGILLILTI